MVYCRLYFLLLTTSCLFCFISLGQTDSLSFDSVTLKDNNQKAKDLFSLGAGLQHGFIFAHSEEVENTKGSHPTGLEAIISWQRVDSAAWSLCNCYPRRGFLLAYHDYDNRVLGKSITFATFLEPTYRISNRTFFAFKGSMGLSYLTHPFDSLKNPFNQSYSTAINGYLQVGIGAWVRLSNRWWINPSISYQHVSNGGMKEPNKGINWPTAGLALSYQPVAGPYYTGRRPDTKFWKGQPLRYDITLFGTARRSVNERGESQRMALVGLATQVGKQVGRINMILAGIEASHDEELRTELKKDSLDASPATVALTVGHEFLLGKFLFSQKLGFYVFDQTPYHDPLYHRWTFLYRPGRLGIGFSMKAHRHIADYMDLRLSYFIEP